LSPDCIDNMPLTATDNLLVYNGVQEAKIDNRSKKIAAKMYLHGRDMHRSRDNHGFIPRNEFTYPLQRFSLLAISLAQQCLVTFRIKPESHLQDHSRSFTVEYIQELTRAQPTLYLREIRVALLENRLIGVDVSTIHNTLEREHIIYKKLHSTDSQRDADIPADFQVSMADYRTRQSVLCDETASDERTYFRLYGCAPVNGPFPLLLSSVEIFLQWVVIVSSLRTL
jgi:hypothetical protein